MACSNCGQKMSEHITVFSRKNEKLVTVCPPKEEVVREREAAQQTPEARADA